MSNTETQPFLIDAEAAKALYKDLRDRVNQIPPPIDPSIVIDDTSESATDKTWSAAKIVEEQNKKAPIIIDSKSGNPIVIDDGIPGLKLYDMKVSFALKQAGTGDPSPSNIRPITGWTGCNIYRTGKNAFDKQYLSNLESYVHIANFYLYTDAIHLAPNTTYTITPSSTEQLETDAYYVLYINSSQTDPDYLVITNPDVRYVVQAGTPKVITFTTGATGVIRFGTTTSPLSVFMSIDWQIEVGSASTEIEPYSGMAIPISWQTEAGTVYGGELDVSSGELIVTHIMVGDIWGNIPKSAPTTETGLTSGYLDFPENVEQCVNQSKYGDSTYCNMCATIIWGNATFTPAHYYINTQNRVWMAFPTDLDSDTPIQVVGKLVTPRVINIDPVQISLLVGANTIWTDADTAEIEYPVDTKKYIDARSSDVKDVQLNGTSILDDGVANVPIMTSSVNGVARVGDGLGMSSAGQLRISSANDSYLKAGTDLYKPVVSGKQHISAFYGLAKLAGVDLANQTVTLGQYPDAAKIAIQKMLGLYQAPWELIREDSFTNAESADVMINTDDYGNSFELTAIRLLVWTPSQETAAIIGSWGEVVFSKSGIAIMSSNISNAQTRTINPSDSRIIGHISIENEGGMTKLTEYRYATLNGEPNITMKAYMDSSLGYYPFRLANDFAIDKVRIKSITGTISVRLYGKRKWT